MNDLQFFHNDEFGQVRGFLDDHGNPWFVAVDVCAALGLDNSREAVSSLDRDEKITVSNPDGNPRAGIPHQFTAISESGLYSLILRSRKPEAKAFKRWVTHEVIPSIRKSGQFAMPQAGQTVTVTVEDGGINDILTYVSVLRQMARMRIYPDRMRMEFLAEAASILSGYPPERFMPSESLCPLFQ